MDEPSWLERLVKLDPALVRGIIVSFFGLLALALGQQFGTEQVETVVSFVVGLFALVAAVFIRPAVTPNAKVIVMDDTPLSDKPTIQPGEATVPPQYDHAVEKAAKEKP